ACRLELQVPFDIEKRLLLVRIRELADIDLVVKRPQYCAVLTRGRQLAEGQGSGARHIPTDPLSPTRGLPAPANYHGHVPVSRARTRTFCTCSRASGVTGPEAVWHALPWASRMVVDTLASGRPYARMKSPFQSTRMAISFGTFSWRRSLTSVSVFLPWASRV